MIHSFSNCSFSIFRNYWMSIFFHLWVEGGNPWNWINEWQKWNTTDNQYQAQGRTNPKINRSRSSKVTINEKMSSFIQDQQNVTEREKNKCSIKVNFPFPYCWTWIRRGGEGVIKQETEEHWKNIEFRSVFQEIGNHQVAENRTTNWRHCKIAITEISSTYCPGAETRRRKKERRTRRDGRRIGDFRTQTWQVWEWLKIKVKLLIKIWELVNRCNC